MCFCCGVSIGVCIAAHKLGAAAGGAAHPHVSDVVDVTALRIMQASPAVYGFQGTLEYALMCSIDVLQVSIDAIY